MPRVPFMGGVLEFDAKPAGPGKIKAVGQLRYPGMVSVGFEADIKLAVGINDPEGVVGGILQVLKKLQDKQES